MPVALRCVKKVSVRQKVLFSLLSFSDFSGSKMRRTSGEHVCRSLFGSLAGEASTSFVLISTILREIEQLSRNELVWLNTYLAGRLRALPPASVHRSCPQLEVTTTAPTTAPGAPSRFGPCDATLAPLPDDALNYSLDPWECTGAAPQDSSSTIATSYTGIHSAAASSTYSPSRLWNCWSFFAW